MSKGYYGFPSKAAYRAHYSDPKKYAAEIAAMEDYTREAEADRSPERTSCRCPSCDAVTEQWWSYCAMCGWHMASGETPSRSPQEGAIPHD